MSGIGSRAAWVALALLAAVQSCASLTPALAEGQPGDPTVAVGPVGSAVARREAGPALRAALAEELEALGGVRVAPRGRARFLVHGSVTRLDREQRDHGVEVRCEVSLIVADARGGNVRVLLSGRAGARGTTDPRVLEQAAVQAAVRGALRPLASSLRSL